MIEETIKMLIIGFPLSPEIVDPRFPVFLQRAGGLVLTLVITVVSLILGVILGTILALGRRDKDPDPRATRSQRAWTRASRGICAIVVEVVRGTPIMLLVLLVFYVPYGWIQLRLPSFLLAIAAFTIYTAVYCSEILRAGFRAVDPGLREAGRVLGMSRVEVLFRIELPIACRTMSADLINLAVTVFKDTSTLAIVAAPELTYVARQLLTAQPMQYAVALVAVLFLYWTPAAFFSSLAIRKLPRQPLLQAQA